jgi:hypothetical protein
MPCDFVVDEKNELVVPMGSWVVGIKFSDEMFQKILDGEYV